MLTPVFSIHWGLQTKMNYEIARKNGIGKSVRDEQNKNNENIYNRYVKELGFKKKLGTL